MQQPTAPSSSLPSSRTLTRASIAAAGLAVVLGLGVVLPAETDRDPLGVGRLIGLSEMGRIKVALAEEAAADARADAAGSSGGATDGVGGVVGEQAKKWRDSMTVTLQPNKGIELKLAMRKNEKATFEWKTDGGKVYYNTHGEPPNAPKDFAAHSYAKGTSASASGELVAVYDGMHGWFWRNRTDKPVSVTLKTGGEYLVLKQM